MLFRCPVCCDNLQRTDNTYRCSAGHSFDLARQGYLNLLSGSHSTAHGDQDSMLSSRRRFLDSGHYSCFAEKLCDLIRDISVSTDDVILDCGCGEGYYTGLIKSRFPKNHIAGFDVSKKAVSMAAARYKDIDFAVASSNAIPVQDNFVKILTNIFSPMSCNEFSRVLSKDGYLIYAVPGPRHLWGLKCEIYDTPYENKIEDTEYPGFVLVERYPERNSITLPSSLLVDLFTMTPYYYRSPRGAIEKLRNISELTTEIEFDFLVYKKR